MSPAAAAAVRHQASPDLIGRSRGQLSRYIVLRISGVGTVPPRHLPRYTYNSQKCKPRSNPVKQAVILEIYRLQLGLLFIYYDIVHSDTLYK